MENDILVTMDGIPIITRDDLEREKARVFDLNPQLKQILPKMDLKMVDRHFLESLIYQKIVKEYIKKHKLDELAIYEAELKMYNNAENQVNENIFNNQFIITVDDTEIKRYYEENKERHLEHHSEFPSYEEVKEKIKEILENEKRKELINQEIDRLKEVYKVEISKSFF